MVYFDKGVSPVSLIGKRVIATELLEAGVFHRDIVGTLVRRGGDYAVDPERINWSSRARAAGIDKMSEPYPIVLGSETTSVREYKVKQQ